MKRAPFLAAGAAVLAVLAVLAHAQPADPPAAISFIACPIYRDTDAGRKSGCWLADDADGTRYDVTLGPAKPQIGRAVLVEGIRSDEPTTACGGIVLNPVRTSNLTTAACSRTIVPAGDYPGRPYKSPPEQLRPASEPRMLPTGPYDARTFSIYFEFGRDFLIYQYSEMILEKIMLYAKASQAHDVLVEGYAATEPLYVRDAGRAGLRRPVHEDSQLATARANMVAEALRRLGVPAATVRVQAHTAPAATADLEQGKLPEPSKRRVVVTITP